MDAITARLTSIRERLATGDVHDLGTELEWAVEHALDLTRQLAAGVTEYAVQSVIDGDPQPAAEYGPNREAVLMRLEQAEPPGYETRVLIRQVVHTDWVALTDPVAEL